MGFPDAASDQLRRLGPVIQNEDSAFKIFGVHFQINL
jgi:hypothetical protein